jgi:hypothetical protein
LDGSSLRVLTLALHNEDDSRLQGHRKPAKMHTRENIEEEMIRGSLEEALKNLQAQGFFTGI